MSTSDADLFDADVRGLASTYTYCILIFFQEYFVDETNTL